MTAPLRQRERCAAHPARPAVDTCPVCARPRCGADAAAYPGCLLDVAPPVTSAVVRRRTPPTDLERLVRAGLGAQVVALLSGPVASEYVQAGVFAYLGPFVVGVVCGATALRAASTDGRGRLGMQVRVIGATLAVIAVAFGFSLEVSQPVLSTSTLLPYLAAAAGAVLWTIPPKRRPAQGAGTEA